MTWLRDFSFRKFWIALLAVTLFLAGEVPSLAQGMNPVTILGGSLESQGAAPTVGSCGTGPAVTAGSTSAMFEITTGTGTGCVITLPGTHVKAPVCMLALSNGVLAAFSWVVAINTGVVTITVTQTSAASKFSGQCIYPSGGR